MSSFSQEVSDAWTTVKTWFEGHVEPEVKKDVAAVENVIALWAAQFETDFGKAALAAVGTIIAGFAVGGIPAVPALASAAGALLVGQGLSIAEADAQTVILNAARTAYNAAVASSSPTPTAGASNG